VLQEAAAVVERFRSEGKTVLLHCVRRSPGPRRWRRLRGVDGRGVSVGGAGGCAAGAAWGTAE
jgi:hypothetical protein